MTVVFDNFEENNNVCHYIEYLSIYLYMYIFHFFPLKTQVSDLRTGDVGIPIWL